MVKIEKNSKPEANETESNLDIIADEEQESEDKQNSKENKDVLQLQDQIKRLKAEFDNYRKRTSREWEKNRDKAAADLFQILLPTLDNLEKAIETMNQEEQKLSDIETYRQGVELIYNNLVSNLAQEGMEAIEVLNQPFDPNVAEAIGVVPSDTEEDHVVTVVQTGWSFRKNVLRPAKVLVSKKMENDEADGEDYDIMND